MALLLLFMPFSGAKAQDVELKASVRQMGEWNSNPLMRVGPTPKALYGSITEPQLRMTAKSEKTSADILAGIKRGLYNQSTFNSTDYQLKTNMMRKGQRLTAGLRLNGDYDTTRTSELTLLGLQSGTVRHIGVSVAPEIAYALSPRSQLQLAGTYQKSEYENSQNYQDYHIVSVSPSYTRAFTSQFSGVVALQAQRYETDEGSLRIVDRVGPSFGGDVKISDKMTLRARLGVEFSQERDAHHVTQAWKMDNVFSSQLLYKGEADMFDLSATRAQQSFSNGTDSLMTTLGYEQTHAFNKKLSMNGALRYQKADYGSERSGQLDVMVTGEAGLKYKIFDHIDLSSLYRHKSETLTGDKKLARQNMATLGLTYRW